MTTSAVNVVLGPSVANLVGIRAGDRNRIMITIKQEGVVIDVTGWEFSAQARTVPSSPDIALQANVSIVDAPGGRIMLAWPGDQVAALLNSIGAETFEGVWDLQVEQFGSVITLVEGGFIAVMDVTRPAVP